jgi:hypothetical protein
MTGFPDGISISVMKMRQFGVKFLSFQPVF